MEPVIPTWEQTLGWVVVGVLVSPVLVGIGYTIYRQIKTWRTGKIE